MSWIVLVLIACSGPTSTDQCTIVESEANVVSETREDSIRKNCDASPNCIEPRKGIFLIRKITPPAVPPPPASSARTPGQKV